MKFKEFLNEDPEALRIDLKELYSKFNKMLFNNELPTNFPVRWNNSKNAAGLVRYGTQIDDEGNKVLTRIVSLSISRALDHDVHDIEATMVHEMIHVWLKTQGIIDTTGGDTAHGIEFQEKRKELENIWGYEIPDTEDVTHKKVATDKKESVWGVVLADKSGKYYMTLYSFNTMMDDWYKIYRTYKTLTEEVGKYNTVWMGYIKTALNHKYSVRRSVKMLTLQAINDAEAEEIKNKILSTEDHAVLKRK